MIANFFDKVSLGAAQILKGFNREAFIEILEANCVLVSFDDDAVDCLEGRATLDLSIRLLARLYPMIQIVNSRSGRYVEDLFTLAQSINPFISLSEASVPTVCLVVGNSEISHQVPVFYIGSNNWNAYLDIEKAVGSGHTENSIGAGAAACLGVANIFRHIFREQLPHGTTDAHISLSLFDFTDNPSNHGPVITGIRLLNPILVGLGAIGNGALWCLRHCHGLTGSITGIDSENVSLSNLQRYILAGQADIDQPKTILAANYFTGTPITFIANQCSWEMFANEPRNRLSEVVFTCVDNTQTRMEAQALLPKKIFNAWTQREDLAVSRHTGFGQQPCLCCLYWPSGERESLSQEIAGQLRLPEPFIRHYLANNLTIDEGLLNAVKAANNIKSGELDGFIGKPLMVFYSDAVCGGTLLKLTEGNNAAAPSDVPCSFESAFAGILLACEMIKDSAGLTGADPATVTRFNLLRKMSAYRDFVEEKRAECICNDLIFLETYHEKWYHESPIAQ